MSSSPVFLLGICIFVILYTAHSNDFDPIPSNASLLNSWFHRNVHHRKHLPLPVAAAEASIRVITVRADGKGQFDTVMAALNSIPQGNTNRVLIHIGPGNYTQKVTIERYKPFITLYGDPKTNPVLVYSGTALEYGTVYCASLMVESQYFSAVNLKFVNSAPRPDGKMVGAQAVAVAIKADYASFYNCSFYGFQDTLLDDYGKHFFKDCYIEGTIDFIFGSGKSLYLNSELHVIPGDEYTFITAHSRATPQESSGYAFVHCRVTGMGQTAFLGRAWFNSPRVIFAYSQLSNVVKPQGWSSINRPKSERSAYFGEYRNVGEGANLANRVAFSKKLNDEDVKPFLSLSYIKASKWLLPPPHL